MIDATFNAGNVSCQPVVNGPLLRMELEIPGDEIKVKVENGCITPEGEVKWNYQTEAAARLIKRLIGIKGISNNITIKSETHDE